MKNLTELQNTVFLAIGPARIAALSLMAIMSNRADEEKATAIFELSAKRIRNAHKMLSTSLPEMLETAEHKLPDGIENRRLACVEVLEPLMSVLRQASGELAALPEPKKEFNSHCLYVLEPALTEFLTQLTQNLLDTDKERGQLREKEMLEAISSAETVGRNIQLIAFNASIEAARIGDMGKGFAVIATEIRELSGKTQTLLDDIAGFLRQ